MALHSSELIALFKDPLMALLKSGGLKVVSFTEFRGLSKKKKSVKHKNSRLKARVDVVDLSDPEQGPCKALGLPLNNTPFDIQCNNSFHL